METILDIKPNSQSIVYTKLVDSSLSSPLREEMIETYLEEVYTQNTQEEDTRCFNMKICLIISCAFLPITFYPLLCLL